METTKPTTINDLVDIENLKLSNEYRKKALTEALGLKKQIEQFHPCSLEYAEDMEICLIYLDKKRKIWIKKDWKGNFNVGYYNRYKYIDSYKVSSISDTISWPNQFKVLSTKKIQDWIDCNILKQELCEAANDDAKAKHDEYIKHVRKLAKNPKVTPFIASDMQFGTLESEVFTFRFELQSNGYVKEEITLKKDYNTPAIEQFSKLIKLR